MSGDREGFLSRWSRQKRREGDVATPAPAATPLPEGTAPTEPEFDISTLPELDSLTEASNALAFMQKGVPDALKNAALRRIWTEDISIRDYIGPVEMGWNFNDPESIPGFGLIAPDTDMAALLRQAVGEADPVAENLQLEGAKTEVVSGEISQEVIGTGGAPEADSEAQVEVSSSESSPVSPVDAENPVLNVADEAETGSFRAIRRHGGALPSS